MCAQSLNRVPLFVTSWTVAHQAPLSVGFPRQGYWSRWPFPSPGSLPDPRIEPRFPVLQADSLLSEPQGEPQNKANYNTKKFLKGMSSILPGEGAVSGKGIVGRRNGICRSLD